MEEDTWEADAVEKDNLARSNKKVKATSGEQYKGREDLQPDQGKRRNTYKELVLGSAIDIIMEDALT